MSVGGPYSPFKILHHGARLAALREGGIVMPAQVQLILSDLCDMACGFCAYRLEGYSSNQHFGEQREDGTVNNNPKRMIPRGKLMEILEDCKAMGVGAIQFTGGGEPTIHPDFYAVVSYAMALGLDVALVTNGGGGRMTDEVARLLAKAVWVRVSLDAGTEDTYAATRRVAKPAFRRTLDNIRLLAQARDDAGSGLILGVGFVVTPENWLEIVDATRLARAAGANNIRISAAFSPQDEQLFAGFYEQAKDLARQAECLATHSFKVFNLFGERLEDLRQHAPDYELCGYQHFVTYIGGDQNVYRCCVTAYNDRGLLGSVKEQRFKDLWVSDLVQAKLHGFDARGCERCMFNGKNRLIAYAAEPRPEHVNFV